jgi:hypothetical protein
LAITVSGLILARRKPRIGADLTGILEPMWIVNYRYDDFGEPWAHTRNSLDQLSSRIFLD